MPVQVDEYLFTPLPADSAPETAACAAPTLTEDAGAYTVAGQGFKLVFSKATGLITQGEAAGETILVGGPYLHMPYFRLGAWQLQSLAARAEGSTVQVEIKGTYKGSAQAAFALSIGGDGGIATRYTVEKLLRPLPHAEKLRVGVDCGGLDELGVYYLAAPGVDSLSWNRKGMHSWYPDDHIARNTGTARRFSAGSVFGEKPQIPWASEMRSFILHGRYDVETRGTNDFRSLKPNIVSASVYAQGGKAALGALSGGTHHVRLEVEDPEAMVVYPGDSAVTMTGSWTAQEDLRGSRGGTEWWSDDTGAAMELTFTGTGAVWYGPVDTVYGMAKVFVDGKLVDARVDQRVAGVDFPGSAAGYDKKYDYPVFSVDGLENGAHTLRIEVSGEKSPDAGAAYIVVDYFRVLHQRGEEPVRFIVCNDYNYPHISWGNYVKSAIMIEDGYTNSVAIQLAQQNKEQ